MEQPKWTGYFKVVDPTPDTVKVTDNISTDASAYNNYSWYQRLVHGSSSRISRYQEYDIMDRDVDVARALDLIAEEMTNRNSKTNLPLNVDLMVEEGRHIKNNLVSTIRVALQHWCSMHKMNTKLFDIARHTIKYGDLFFRRYSERKSWEYINSKHVVAAVVDSEDAEKIIAYQIRKDIKKPRQNAGGSVPVHQEYETEIVPATEIVRFTLNDDMSEQAPFGESVLASVYRVQKQKELLEDAIVIYRVQRAPERRVFYIDVGKMPPNRTKQYLETIKNEIRQKKVPSMGGGTDGNIDSTYNPQSMSEDFYFASRQGGAGSRVETLPGGQNLGELGDLEYFRSKVLEGLRIPPSYLPNFETQDLSGSFSDGNVGTAYMQEIQFFKYVERLQQHINEVIDIEFKRFMQALDIRIDESMYKISLPLPTNFEKYKEAAVDGELLSQFANADGVEYLSKRFIMTRYLKLSPDEVAANEMMLRQERGLDPNDGKALVRLYNPDLMDMESPDSEDGGGFGGGGFDSGGPEDLPEDGDLEGGDDTTTTDSAEDDTTPTDPDNT